MEISVLELTTFSFFIAQVLFIGCFPVPNVQTQTTANLDGTKVEYVDYDNMMVSTTYTADGLKLMEVIEGVGITITLNYEDYSISANNRRVDKAVNIRVTKKGTVFFDKSCNPKGNIEPTRVYFNPGDLINVWAWATDTIGYSTYVPASSNSFAQEAMLENHKERIEINDVILIFDYEMKTVSIFNETTNKVRVIIFCCSKEICTDKYAVFDQRIDAGRSVDKKEIFLDKYFKIEVHLRNGIVTYPPFFGRAVPDMER